MVIYLIMKKDIIAFSDFNKLDLRVGEVKNASQLEGSKKLITLEVDLGDDYGTVEILSGLAEFYKPEDLIGNKYIVLANLEPKKMMGEMSEGMLFDIGYSNGIIPVLAIPEKPVPDGVLAG